MFVSVFFCFSPSVFFSLVTARFCRFYQGCPGADPGFQKGGGGWMADHIY